MLVAPHLGKPSECSQQTRPLPAPLHHHHLRHRRYLWITIVYNLTYTVALYGLLLFYLVRPAPAAPAAPAALAAPACRALRQGGTPRQLHGGMRGVARDRPPARRRVHPTPTSHRAHTSCWRPSSRCSSLRWSRA